jgi:hypothetical protein
MWFFCLEARPLISSTASTFLCSNNVSIGRQYVCDLHKDCPEGEDEEQDCGECNNKLIKIIIIDMKNMIIFFFIYVHQHKMHQAG